MKKDFYRTGEVAKKIGVSKNTIYEWLAKKKIPEVAKDRNKRRMFTEKDVAYMKAFKNKVFPPPRVAL